jgi:hypothetical protein
MLRNHFKSSKVMPSKTIIAAQGVNAVFGMAGVVDEIESLMPRPPLGGEHEAVNGGHDFGERRRPAPVAGRAAIDRLGVHQRHQRARGLWGSPSTTSSPLAFLTLTEYLGGPAGVGASLEGIFSGVSGGAFDGFDNRFILGHNGLEGGVGIKKWCARRELNPQPAASEAVTLSS